MGKSGFFFLATVIGVLAVSCQEKAEQHSNRYAYIDTQVTQHARLALTPHQDSSDIIRFTYYDYALEPGHQLVFALDYASGDSTHEDNGTSESAVFEVPDTATSFHIRDREFVAHNGLYANYCLCPEPTANKARRIVSGNSVAGRQLTPFTWLIRSEIAGIHFTDTIDIRTKNRVNLLE